MFVLPKTQHPTLLHTHAPKGKLMDPTLHWYLMLRTHTYILGPNHPPLLQVPISYLPTSSFIELFETHLQPNLPITKYTRWWKCNWTPSKSYNATCLLPAEGRPDCLHPVPSHTEGNKGSTRVAIRPCNHWRENATFGVCPMTQEERAEH